MVEINNLTTNVINEKKLKSIAQAVLRAEKKEKENLSIALIGPGRMRKLNKKYRGKNQVTDVLAFPNKKIGKAKFITPLEQYQGLGEIVICPREVKKNVKRFKSTFEKELVLCLIHGILHILGYNHEKSEKKAKQMRKKEELYLSLYGKL